MYKIWELQNRMSRMSYPCLHASFVFHVQQKYHQPLLLHLILSWHIEFSVLITYQ